jgi:hypothetical protein
MSNLSDLLDDIGIANGAPVELIGDTIGTLADAAGGVGAIVSLIGLFTSTGDQTEAELQNILSTIQSDFAQLNAADQAGRLITRLTNVANQVGPAQAVLDTLSALVNLQPPATGAVRIQTIDTCITALNDLTPDIIWEAVYTDQIYWSDYNEYFALNEFGQISDAGYGQQQPAQVAPNSDLVFSYIYILPAYLHVLFIFLAVAAALDPDFGKNYADSVIRPAVTLLKNRHDQIVGGITQLSPGSWDGQSLWTQLSLSLVPPPLWKGVSPIPPFPPSGTPILPTGLLTGANIEYGAVEKFSGYSSMANYQLSFGTDFEQDSSDPTPYNKFQLRLLKRAKDVYTSVGLLKVWKTINNLKTIVGDSPLPRPNFADWSFNRDIIKVSNFPVPSNRHVSLLAIAKFIKHTPPLDTDQRPSFTTSFRELLNH